MIRTVRRSPGLSLAVGGLCILVILALLLLGIAMR